MSDLMFYIAFVVLTVISVYSLISLIHDELEIYYLKKKIKQVIKIIEENCIDDEFYLNLTNKEKTILYALEILKGDDKEWIELDL